MSGRDSVVWRAKVGGTKMWIGITSHIYWELIRRIFLIVFFFHLNDVEKENLF
jgi:hypothetical protein